MEKVKLGDVVVIKTGKLDVNLENPNGKYPFFTCSKNHTFIDYYAFEGESVLVAGNGDLNVKYYNGKFNAYQRTYVIQTKESLNGKYLYYFLDSYVEKLRNQSIGGVIKYIKLGNLTQALIPLPDLAIQKRIAAKLDKADELRQYNQQLIKKYDELTQSLFLDMFGDPVKNEKGWEKVKLKEVCTKIGSGSTPRGGKEGYKTEGISLIRSMNVYDNYFLFKDLAFIDDDQAEKLKNVVVEENDVLFNITGASICRCTIVPKKILPARVNQHVAIIRPVKDKLIALFLNHLLVSIQIKRDLMKIGGGGGAVMEAITKEHLENFPIILPPLSLQNEFASRVQAIEVQKALAEQALAKSEELFQSLLKASFS